MSTPLFRAFRGQLPKARATADSPNIHHLGDHRSQSNNNNKRRAVEKPVPNLGYDFPHAQHDTHSISGNTDTEADGVSVSESDTENEGESAHSTEDEVNDSEDTDSPNSSAAGLPNTQDSHQPFQYGQQPQFSSDQLLQIMLYKVMIDGNVSHAVHEQYCDVISRFVPGNVKADRRTIEANLDRLTGVQHIRYDACSTGCCAYTGAKAERASCFHCKAPRVFGPGKRATFDYIEVIHRLKLWYSSYNRAHELKRYVKMLNDTRKSGWMRDVWDGKLVQKLRKEGMLVSQILHNRLMIIVTDIINTDQLYGSCICLLDRWSTVV